MIGKTITLTQGQPMIIVQNGRQTETKAEGAPQLDVKPSEPPVLPPTSQE